MSNEIFFPNPLPVGGVSKEYPKPKPGQAPGAPRKEDFGKILESRLPTQELKFSQHAQERLRSRGINFTDAEMQKLKGAVDDVAKKGGKESLIMLGDAALVVSIKNRTVVTAMERGARPEGNVFTNIDSAVVF